MAVEDVTLVLADFCSGLIQEQCKATGLVLEDQQELSLKTYLTRGGFLRPHEVAALKRKLRGNSRLTEGQKRVLSWWHILLDYWDMLTVGTVETILFYRIPLGDLDGQHGGDGAAAPSQRQTKALARLEGLLLDKLSV